MADDGNRTWAYATLTMEQPRWPGTKGADWVAATAAGQQFRTKDVHEALDRLGAEGWEMVAPAAQWGDRHAALYFKRPR